MPFNLTRLMRMPFNLTCLMRMPFNLTCLMRMPFNLTCLMRMPFKASLRKSNYVYKPCNNHLQDSVLANKYWPIPTITHALIESDEMCVA
jgi:phenylalanine-4-hydroxylase